MIKENRYLITGITGTMGTELCRVILQNEPNCRIVGISRDEQKQQAFPIKDSRVRLKIANVADRRSLYRAAYNSSLLGYDCIFHLAAAKCAPFIESNPYEAVQVNVEGTQNVLDLAMELSSKVAFTSSDKAVKPINAYGMTKALGEKLVLAASPDHLVYRYGNVLGSRGSFFPVIVEKLRSGQPVPITDLDMTRFWLTQRQVAAFIYGNYKRKGLLIPEMGAAGIVELVAATAKALCFDAWQFEEIGLRPGEKIHEDIDEQRNSGQRSHHYKPEELKRLVNRALNTLGILGLSCEGVASATKNDRSGHSVCEE